MHCVRYTSKLCTCEPTTARLLQKADKQYAGQDPKTQLQRILRVFMNYFAFTLHLRAVYSAPCRMFLPFPQPLHAIISLAETETARQLAGETMIRVQL